MKQYLMEFVGTFFLVLSISLTGNPMAIGLTLMAMIYTGGHISGAHYNPAVTLSVYLRGKLEAKYIPGYMLSQLFGAFTGAACFHFLSSDIFFLEGSEDISSWKTCFVEALFTFVLCSVVLNMATSDALKGNHVYGVVIGGALMAIAFAGGPISGGAFNPAVACGPMLYDTILGGSSLSFAWIYLIGPFTGGMIAAYLYNYLNND